MRSVAMREDVSAALRQAILEGQFEPGESLPEVTLAEQMSVSRGPVREALLILAQEGLLSHSQNRGFTVFNMSLEDFEAIRTVRIPLEGLALQLAREKAQPEDLRQLELLSDNLQFAFAHESFRKSINADLAFHVALWEMTGNSWLCGLLKRVMIPQFAFGMAYCEKPPDLTTEILRERHRQYLDFLKGDCKESAEDCVRFHVNLARSSE